MGKNRKFWLLLALTLLWMGVIFAFSAQDGEASSKTSGVVVDRVVRITHPEYQTLSKAAQVSIRSRVSFLVRKAAHVSEYLILGVLVTSLFLAGGLRAGAAFLLALPVCVLYAGSDELHQMYTAGRGPALADVGIDSTGALFGIAMVMAVRKLRAGKRRGSR